MFDLTNTLSAKLPGTSGNHQTGAGQYHIVAPDVPPASRGSRQRRSHADCLRRIFIRPGASLERFTWNGDQARTLYDRRSGLPRTIFLLLHRDPERGLETPEPDRRRSKPETRDASTESTVVHEFKF